MKSIIGGGATTILVSHSIAQVRSMCNKILWLDHGKQITFGDNVKLICEEYEKFLKTKSLPDPKVFEPKPLEPAKPAEAVKPENNEDKK